MTNLLNFKKENILKYLITIIYVVFIIMLVPSLLYKNKVLISSNAEIFGSIYMGDTNIGKVNLIFCKITENNQTYTIDMYYKNFKGRNLLNIQNFNIKYNKVILDKSNLKQQFIEYINEDSLDSRKVALICFCSVSIIYTLLILSKNILRELKLFLITVVLSFLLFVMYNNYILFNLINYVVISLIYTTIFLILGMIYSKYSTSSATKIINPLIVLLIYFLNVNALYTEWDFAYVFGFIMAYELGNIKKMPKLLNDKGKLRYKILYTIITIGIIVCSIFLLGWSLRLSFINEEKISNIIAGISIIFFQVVCLLVIIYPITLSLINMKNKFKK